jgi:hypothetical protein
MSPATQNMAIEAVLTFMVLLLAMSIVAIFSTPPTPAGIPAGAAENNPAAGHHAAPAPAVESAAGIRGQPTSAEARRRRYEGRHSAGYVSGQRSGPPWEPADRPPGAS